MSFNEETYYSHGKLLITGEYCIMHGGIGWAVPSALGQKLTVKIIQEPLLRFISSDKNGVFYTGDFELNTLEAINSDRFTENVFISQILKAIRRKNPSVFEMKEGLEFCSNIEFDRSYGLGSSSSFIVNMAKWAQVNPFEIHQSVSFGSGYDVVIGELGIPILYKKQSDNYTATPTHINAMLRNEAVFVYSGKKQATENHIVKFKPNVSLLQSAKQHISEITEKLIKEENISSIVRLISEHEKIVGELIEKTPVKTKLFSDFEGAIKSCGAWGGDFYLAVSHKGKDYIKNYFFEHNYKTLFNWQEMVK